MTLILFDGFDHGLNSGAAWNDDLWDAQPTGGLSGSVTRFGSGFSLAKPNGSEEFKTIGSNVGEIILGVPMWATASGGATTAPFTTLYDGATAQCTVCAETNGDITLRRGTYTGAIVATVAASFTRDLAYDGFAFRIKFSATVGEFQVWKNGASILNVNALNNISTANAYCTKFSLGPSTHFSTYMDDVYAIIVDATAPNSFPGDTRVYPLLPDGAGASTQWTPSSGSNFSNVGRASGTEDSNYNADSTPGDLDEYTLGNLPGGFLGTVIAFQSNGRARKDDAGLRQYAMRHNSGGTTQDCATQTLSGAYVTHREHFVKDWNGNIDWTPAAINALKMGPLEVA